MLQALLEKSVKMLKAKHEHRVSMVLAPTFRRIPQDSEGKRRMLSPRCHYAVTLPSRRCHRVATGWQPPCHVAPGCDIPAAGCRRGYAVGRTGVPDLRRAMRPAYHPMFAERALGVYGEAMGKILRE